MLDRFSKLLLCTVVALCCATSLNAQDDWYSYQLVPRTVYEKQPVTITRWVNETVNEKRNVTTYKPIYQTETRHRTTTSYKPVRKTSEREVKTTNYKPVTETLYREKRTEETVYETVTQFRDEEYTYREPVVETSMREERITVRKPVTQKLIEVKKTTTYRPVAKPETQLVPAQIVVPTVARDPYQRSRMLMLQPGYYTDPVTGLSVYRRRGLHWVSPNIPAATVAPALVPMQTGKVGFESKTVEERNPIEVTRYVDEVETRTVPVEVERMVERTATRRVPYKVKLPKTKVTTEQIPYTQTTYKEEVVVKKVPYVETTYQRVEQSEPYEVEIKKWIPVTREVVVPKIVRRKVERTVMQDVPRKVLMKIPFDSCGNPIGPATEVHSPAPAFQWPVADNDSNISSSMSTTTTRRPSIPTSEKRPVESYKGTLVLEAPGKTLDETSGEASGGESVLVGGDSGTSNNATNSTLQPIVREAEEIPKTAGTVPSLNVPEATMPEDLPAETGDDKADERVPESTQKEPRRADQDEDDRI